MTENRKFERQQFGKDEDKGFEKKVSIGEKCIGVGVICGFVLKQIKKHPELLEKGVSLITRKKL